MTNGTASAPVAYNPRWEDIEFPNPSISSKKWNFSYDDAKSLEKTLVAVIPFGAIVIFFALFSRFSPLGQLFADSGDVGGWVFFGIFMTMFVTSLIVASKVAKRVVKNRERNRDEYRAANASTIIDILADKGWKIVGRDAVQTLIKDNNPYLVNENGTRYYARQFHIGTENVTLMVELSDAEVEKEMKDEKKQNRIEFLVKRYETANGPMSEEMKAGFIAGLNMGLPVE
jgi:uncharacterized membrane protein